MEGNWKTVIQLVSYNEASDKTWSYIFSVYKKSSKKVHDSVRLKDVRAR